MTEEQYQQYLIEMKNAIKEAVAPAIETTVNGKIRGLTVKLDNYILTDTEWKKDDATWKIGAQPTIDLGNDMRGFGKVFGYVAAGLAGLYTIIRLLLLFITHK